MAIVVRNDSAGEIQISGLSNITKIQPGEVRTLTEIEYQQVGWNNRGPGRLVTIAPEENTSETQQLRFDYYDPGDGTFQVKYIGYARPLALTSDLTWTIRRHEHTLFGGNYMLSHIEVLLNVAWDNRASLPWT